MHFRWAIHGVLSFSANNDWFRLVARSCFLLLNSLWHFSLLAQWFIVEQASIFFMKIPMVVVILMIVVGNVFMDMRIVVMIVVVVIIVVMIIEVVITVVMIIVSLMIHVPVFYMVVWLHMMMRWFNMMNLMNMRMSIYRMSRF